MSELIISFGDKKYKVSKDTLASTYIEVEDSLIDLMADEVYTYIPGLYAAGAIETYKMNGFESIQSLLIKSWDALIEENIIHVVDGAVYTNCDVETYFNSSSDILDGDLFIPYDSNITKIGSVHINNDQDYTGQLGFSSCTKLSGIFIPNGIVEITTSAFDSCINLSTVKLPVTLRKIDSHAFSDCENLSYIELPNNCVLEDEVFYYYNSLTSIKIPQKMTVIKEYTFFYNEALEEVILPRNLTKIESFAFAGCKLSSVELPKKLVEIGASAFHNCPVTDVYFPDNVTHIDDCAFQECPNLTSISLPASLEYIGERAFAYCPKLESITFRASHPAEWRDIQFGEDWNSGIPATRVWTEYGDIDLDNSK